MVHLEGMAMIPRPAPPDRAVLTSLPEAAAEPDGRRPACGVCLTAGPAGRVAPGDHASGSQAAGGFPALGWASLALGLTALLCHGVGLLAVIATVRSNGFLDAILLGAAIAFGAVLSLAGLVLGAVACYAGKGPGTAGILGCLVSGAPLGVLLLACFLSRAAATPPPPVPSTGDFIPR
jgi:hypothetical protein